MPLKANIIHIDVSGRLLSSLAPWKRYPRIPESDKLLLVTSEIQELIFLLDSGFVYIEIRKTAQGIRNPSNDWISESKFHWHRSEPSTGNLELIQDCLVFPYMVRRFNAGWYLFRFRRLRYRGKQQQLFEDFKRLAILCSTKCEFCLETLLACICWRMGCKNISLTMWWQGTDCNNNKGREIYLWRIYQCIMG